MTDNLNENGNIHECSPGEGNPRNMVPYEEIEIFKTEVKEELYDFEMSVDNIEFVHVKEDGTFLPENKFENGDLELLKSRERSLNLNGRKYEIRKVYCREKGYRYEPCYFNFDDKLYTNSHDEHYAKQKLPEPVDLKCGNASKRYNCAHCTFSTAVRINFRRHVRIHSREDPFKCTFKNCKCTFNCECNTCEYVSIWKSHLERHILMRHSTEPKQYKCVDCNYATHSKTHLSLHICTHTKDKSFLCTYKDCRCAPEFCGCNVCGYAAARKWVLKQHILAKHSTQPKKYKCKDCKFATHVKTDLMRHIGTHTNDKPFKCTHKNCKCIPDQEESCTCNTCEYSSARKNSLKLHILSKHSVEQKKYQCKDCKYASHYKENLVAHCHNHIHGGHNKKK